MAYINVSFTKLYQMPLNYNIVLQGNISVLILNIFKFHPYNLLLQPKQLYI